jgi:hypothetical protein
LNEKRCKKKIGEDVGDRVDILKIIQSITNQSKILTASNHTNPEIKSALKAINNFTKQISKKTKTRKNSKKQQIIELLYTNPIDV